MPDADISDALCARVGAAHREASPLYINGGGSKRHVLGRHCHAATLEEAFLAAVAGGPLPRSRPEV